jgi:hypothetical protein
MVVRAIDFPPGGLRRGARVIVAAVGVDVIGGTGIGGFRRWNRQLLLSSPRALQGSSGQNATRLIRATSPARIASRRQRRGICIIADPSQSA